MSRKKQLKHRKKKHVEGSKVTIADKTYDLNFLGKTKKTNLRRKMTVEYIESKPAGTIIQLREFMELCRFNQIANTDAFIKRMIRDGVIQRWEGDKPKSYYYAVVGKARQKTPPTAKPESDLDDVNLTNLVKHMNTLGVKFTITIESK